MQVSSQMVSPGSSWVVEAQGLGKEQ